MPRGAGHLPIEGAESPASERCLSPPHTATVRSGVVTTDVRDCLETESRSVAPPEDDTKQFKVALIISQNPLGHDYNPTYCKELIKKHVRKRMSDNREPTWDEFQGCLRAPKNKSAQPDGVPPHLLRHLLNHMQQQLYLAILDIWRGNKIPHTWLASRVVLIYKKKDPQDPKNYRPIYVSTAIYGILIQLLLKRITKAMTPGLPPPPCPTNTVSNEHFLFGPYFFGT